MAMRQWNGMSTLKYELIIYLFEFKKATELNTALANLRTVGITVRTYTYNGGLTRAAARVP